MRLMVESYARQLFFRFFLIKNKKAGPARKMMWVFILFILLVKNLLLQTDVISFLTAQFSYIYKRFNNSSVVRNLPIYQSLLLDN